MGFNIDKLYIIISNLRKNQQQNKSIVKLSIFRIVTSRFLKCFKGENAKKPPSNHRGQCIWILLNNI